MSTTSKKKRPLIEPEGELQQFRKKYKIKHEEFPLHSEETMKYTAQWLLEQTVHQKNAGSMFTTEASMLQRVARISSKTHLYGAFLGMMGSHSTAWRMAARCLEHDLSHVEHLWSLSEANVRDILSRNPVEMFRRCVLVLHASRTKQ